MSVFDLIDSGGLLAFATAIYMEVRALRTVISKIEERDAIDHAEISRMLGRIEKHMEIVDGNHASVEYQRNH